MPLTPSFTISTTTDPSAMVLDDNSTGSDGAIVGRQILLYQANGSLLVPISAWALATNPITINPLNIDYALNVVVQWLSNTGAILYTTSQLFVSIGYIDQFLTMLTQEQINTNSPNILQDQDYYANKFKLFTNRQSAINSIDVQQSLFNGQACILLCQGLMSNAQLYF